MRKMRAIWIRMISLFVRRGDRDSTDELQAHVELATSDGIRSGLSPEEARRKALIGLGGAEQTRQALRDRNTLPTAEMLWSDIRYSFRTLARRKSATLIAVLSIGLGIGANATIFSLVSRFLLRAAPVGDPATLLERRWATGAATSFPGRCLTIFTQSGFATAV